MIEIRESRVRDAASRGVVLTHDEIYAPLTVTELDTATRSVRTATGNASYSAPEAADRLESMVVEE